MSWLSKLIDLFYDYKELIVGNSYLFVVYGLICVGLTLGINKWLNTRTEKQNRDKIAELKETIEALEMENESLRKRFNKYGVEPRLMAGTDNEPSAPSAKLIADSINKKK